MSTAARPTEHNLFILFWNGFRTEYINNLVELFRDRNHVLTYYLTACLSLSLIHDKPVKHIFDSKLASVYFSFSSSEPYSDLSKNIYIYYIYIY